MVVDAQSGAQVGTAPLGVTVAAFGGVTATNIACVPGTPGCGPASGVGFGTPSPGDQPTELCWDGIRRSRGSCPPQTPAPVAPPPPPVARPDVGWQCWTACTNGVNATYYDPDRRPVRDGYVATCPSCTDTGRTPAPPPATGTCGATVNIGGTDYPVTDRGGWDSSGVLRSVDVVGYHYEYLTKDGALVDGAGNGVGTLKDRSKVTCFGFPAQGQTPPGSSPSPPSTPGPTPPGPGPGPKAPGGPTPSDPWSQIRGLWTDPKKRPYLIGAGALAGLALSGNLSLAHLGGRRR
jgi:hypothetical protein